MMKARGAAAPFALWMAIFTVVPLGVVVYYAFTTAEGTFTLENIWAIHQYAGSLLRSLWIGLLSTAICLVLAYPLAFSISRAKGRVQQTMVMLIMMPMWMNFLLRTYAWQSLLENNGFINQFLKLFGLHFNMINTTGAVVLGMVYNFLPFMILPLYSVMVKIDRSVIEAAQDLGSNAFQVFGRVILPLSVPGIISGITMVLIPIISTFAITQILGGSLVNMIGDNIEMKFFGTAPDYNVGSALALLLMVLLLISMGVMNAFDKDGEGVAV